MFGLFKKWIRSRRSSGPNNKKWRKVSELAVGMKIAVPRDGLLEDHLHRPGADIVQADIEPSRPAPSPDIVWDEIAAIKKLGRERVYDIEVAGSHNFVANNIFAHNTYISGKVGIGTSSPDYQVTVGGEVAAQGFVNISSEATKKDIAYLSEDEDLTILEKIRATNVATYQYKNDQTPNTKHQENTNNQSPITNDLTAGKRLGLIAENAPAEVLATGGKGVDLYKLGTFVLAGLKAESKERESGVLALDTRIAAEMAGLREKATTKQLTVLGSANGDLLYIATGEAMPPLPSREGPGEGLGSVDNDPGSSPTSSRIEYGTGPNPSSGRRGMSDDPIFRITSSGEVQVRDDIVFGPRTSVVALNEPQWVVALSEDEAQEQLRPAYKGAVIVAGAGDGIHVFNPKTHKEMSGYEYTSTVTLNNSSVILSEAKNLSDNPQASSTRSFAGAQDDAVKLLRQASSTGSLNSALADSGSARDDGGVLPTHIASDYFTQPFDENTIAQYPFKTLADATGRGNDLNMSGNVSLAAEGVRGAGAAFDGSGYLSAPAPSLSFLSAHVETQHAASLPPPPHISGAALTLGAWVKFNSLAAGQKIISQDGAFSLALGDGGKAEVTAQGAGRVATRKSLPALDNDWHYVVASYSALKARLDVYVDGALANGDLEGEIPLTGLGVSSEPVKLGAGLYGVLDDVFISAADVDVSSSAALASSPTTPFPLLGQEGIRTNYLIGKKALNYGLAATSGLQATPSSAAIDEVNNMLYVGTTDGQIITVDLGADAVVGRQNITLTLSEAKGKGLIGQPRDPSAASVETQHAASLRDDGITSLAVSSGAGRTLAAIVDNQLWLDTETVSVRDSLALAVETQHAASLRGDDGHRTLTVFEDLLVTGGKILPEASSGLPLFAITADGVAEGLAFRDVSFANELVNASFEYWDNGLPVGWSSVASTPSAVVSSEARNPLYSGNDQYKGSLTRQPAGSGQQKDAKFGLSSIQITDGVLSTTLSNGSDFASSTVTLSAWVKTDKPDDVKLVITMPPSVVSTPPPLARGGGKGGGRDPLYSGQPSISGSSPDPMDIGSGSEQQSVLASSAYHSGSGQWERLIVSVVIPSPSGARGRNLGSAISGDPSADVHRLRDDSKGNLTIQIISASKTALVDGVMLQRGSLPTAFVPSVADTMLANPQYLNFTTVIAASASSTPIIDGIIAKLPVGTFANAIRIDQLSVGLISSPPLQGGEGVVTITAEAPTTPSPLLGQEGIAQSIVCIASGSSCRSSGSLIITPEQELLIKYSVQGMDAGSVSGMTIGATINLRYYPLP